MNSQIQEIFTQNRSAYGAPRIQAVLRSKGSRHGRNRIAKLMRQNGLYARQKLRFKPKTTDSNHSSPIAPNRLLHQPPPSAPNQVWLGDITYIPTQEGTLYLAAIMDRFSRKIVGWSMRQSLDSSLVIDAWNMAVTHRNPPANLLFHSDRGVQYASSAFRLKLLNHRAIASMSRKANCYDNSPMESFWSTLKSELVYKSPFLSITHAKLQIFSYIESFYNTKRIHSSLNFLSPLDFENSFN